MLAVPLLFMFVALIAAFIFIIGFFIIVIILRRCRRVDKSTINAGGGHSEEDIKLHNQGRAATDEKLPLFNSGGANV